MASILSQLGAYIKAKLDTKADKINPTFVGSVTLPADTKIGSISSESVGFLVGTTSNVQEQINALDLNKLDKNSNSISATKLQTARTINGVAFDGTANITITDNTKQDTLVSGTNIKTINGSSILGNGNISIVDTAGNSATATKLQTARTINGVSFDGTANIVITDSSKIANTNGVSNTPLNSYGSGNDYYTAGFVTNGNGSANTIFPTIGFHQQSQYASSIQLRGAADFRFYNQGTTSYANISANQGTFTSRVSATSPNSGTTGAIQLTDAPGNTNTVYLQAVNNAQNVQYSYLKFDSNGTIYSSGSLTVQGTLNADGGLSQDGFAILNGSDTWLRTNGSTGWYNATFNGGMYMTDSTWVRTYSSKGLLTDGALSVGSTANIKGDLTVGSAQNYASITMSDSDEGNRVIHCNSNKIGFLNQAGSWGSYCNDDGSWTSDFYMSTPVLKANVVSANISCTADIWNQGSCANLMWNTQPHSESFRECNGFSDAPNSGWWFIKTRRHSNSSNIWGTQIAYGWEDNANRVYQRNVSAGTWSSWYLVSDAQANTGSSGYCRIGSTIIQWGNCSHGSGGNYNGVGVTFPIAFPNACVSAVASGINSIYQQYLGPDSDSGRICTSISRTGMTVNVGYIFGGGYNNVSSWFAIGY